MSQKDYESKENPYKYPLRTDEARIQAQIVADTMNKTEGISNRSSPVISVFTHKNGDVSVGISGSVDTDKARRKVQNNADKLQAELDKIQKGKYTVSGESIDTSKIIEPENKGNAPGQCAEAKAAKAASENTNDITGMDTVWRGDPSKNNHGKGIENQNNKTTEELLNEHDIKTNDIYGQMNPCATCAANEEVYMKEANKNKNGK